jgi:DNA helicase HerA-like ATPase
MDGENLGLVIEGSLIDGLKAKLDPSASVEDLRVGKFVKISGERHDFFCLITDIQLSSTDPRALQDPPEVGDDYMRKVLAGTTTYGAIKIQPMLMLPRLELSSQAEPGPLPVRTVPTHFSRVYEADEQDFEEVFGSEAQGHFQIGKPLDMEVPVCLDLRRFVQRSNGVFGKSGTGKSFLTRLLLCGVIQSAAAVNLVFDMHSEYGHGNRSEDEVLVQGLQDLFGRQKVVVLGLDGGSDGRRAVRADGLVSIGLNEIEVEDVALLQDELRLNATAVETANLVVDAYRERWIEKLLEMDSDQLREFVERSGAHPGALAALKRKLGEIRRLAFVREHVGDSHLDAMLAHLEQGRHIVLEFGQFSRPLPYMLVANVITRRIHRRWSQLAEARLQSRGSVSAPRQLMITIEEAHKFLSTQVANQTIFGTIAREMRKFQVTLLVVDQRPSGIDDEVLSQIGTRITCQLNDDRDIEAVFSGVSGASHLRSVLANLDSRQQAMVLGHAVPMPVVIRSRPYDETFYAAVRPWGNDPAAAEVIQLTNARNYREIFGSDDNDS